MGMAEEQVLGNTIGQFNNYSPVGDIITITMCMAIFLLTNVAYISRTRSYNLYRNTVVCLLIAALGDLGYHTTLSLVQTMPAHAIYIPRVIYHIALFGALLTYIFYAGEILSISDETRTRYETIATSVFSFVAINEILGIAFKYQFYIDKNHVVHKGINWFPAGYAFFVIMITVMILRYRQRVYKRVVVGVLANTAISFLILIVQGLCNQTSFTIASFIFPTVALLYLMHSNPYDSSIGAVSAASFEDHVAAHQKDGKEMLLMSLLLMEYEASGKRYPIQLQNTIRRFTTYFFKKAVLFQVTSGRIMLAIDIDKIKNYDETVQKMLAQFDIEHEHFRLDHKVTIVKTSKDVHEQNDYIGLIQYVEEKSPDNSVIFVNSQDVENYNKHKYIINELADIHEKKDLNDSRIEVFCQPVYNVNEEVFDTAEALMRLRLPKTGMVYPDQFIPIAEKHHFISVMSLIILSKTCAEVKKLLKGGYVVKRVSVNISMQDVREKDFCANVSKIVREHNVPFEKIALEITESQNEKDFDLVKERISELREMGMRVYLDDFGTGYSNFERIMELPFDIIKFDRSLVIASAADIKSETMVSYLAHMFSDMNYSVLYEGVENEDDENRCGRMCAKYLQGYKYSKPIPIDQLTDYFVQIQPA